MFPFVESHINSRLSKVLFEGNPMRVLPYEPDRDKGASDYPFYAIQFLYYREDKGRAKPNCEIFVPSEEQETVEFPAPGNMGGPKSITGPMQFTKKPYPTPYDIGYDLHVYATDPAVAKAMLLKLAQAFPIGYMPKIGEPGKESWPLFTKGTPQDDDEPDKPLFHKIVPLWVEGVWIDRLEEEEHSSISSPELDSEITNYDVFQ
jgi:hypothetical protein